MPKMTKYSPVILTHLFSKTSCNEAHKNYLLVLSHMSKEDEPHFDSDEFFEI